MLKLLNTKNLPVTKLLNISPPKKKKTQTIPQCLFKLLLLALTFEFAMCPAVDASYLMGSSPPQLCCLNCSASQVCSQDGTLYQVRGTHDGTYGHHSALC